MNRILLMAVFLLLVLPGRGMSQRVNSPSPPCFGISTSQGCYTELKDSSGNKFRDDDPFLFCTQGMVKRPRAWSLVNPVMGIWEPSPYCCPSQRFHALILIEGSVSA